MPQRAKGVRLIRQSRDFDGCEAGEPFWSSSEVEVMNDRFRQRMLDAIACDLEHCPTAVSTAACTRFPISGYRRPDTN
jgi:hypothetical protein